MPQHKRQHYVPRCYFKSFSLNHAGVAINLYNIQHSRTIRNVSVKGQCAKDYLYGEDLGLERALQNFEGEYARVLRLLQNAADQPTNEDLALLRAFAYLQYARTDMAIRRRRMIQEEMYDAIYKGRPVTPPDLDLSDRAVMHDTMRTYSDAREYIEDLKTCIVKNETRSDFLTSDDPSIFTSRFYVQKLNKQTFGLMSSGALFFLPLTSRLLLMCYDGGVYTIPDKNGCYVSIANQADVLALNELQYLKAANNIYFSQWDDHDRVQREFRAVSMQRPQSWCNISVLVPDGVTEEGERYRRATEEERRTGQHMLIAMSMFHTAPSKWISKLKYRSPVRAHSDGSAVGYVRKKAWLTSDHGRDIGSPYGWPD